MRAMSGPAERRPSRRDSDRRCWHSATALQRATHSRARAPVGRRWTSALENVTSERRARPRADRLDRIRDRVLRVRSPLLAQGRCGGRARRGVADSVRRDPAGAMAEAPRLTFADLVHRSTNVRRARRRSRPRMRCAAAAAPAPPCSRRPHSARFRNGAWHHGQGSDGPSRKGRRAVSSSALQRFPRARRSVAARGAWHRVQRVERSVLSGSIAVGRRTRRAARPAADARDALDALEAERLVQPERVVAGVGDDDEAFGCVILDRAVGRFRD